LATRHQDNVTEEARRRPAGCEIVRAEKVSGKSRDSRDNLAAILEFIRPGDELVVVKLDRLGRATRDVLNLVYELEQKGAGLLVLEPEFSASGDTGRMMGSSEKVLYPPNLSALTLPVSRLRLMNPPTVLKAKLNSSATLTGVTGFDCRNDTFTQIVGTRLSHSSLAPLSQRGS
jgi:hypothetical protein